MPTKQTARQNWDDQIFQNLHRDQTIEPENLGLSKESFDEAIENHYYLAPRNLLRAQFLYVLLEIILALAIAAVRVGNDFGSVLFVGVIGVCTAIPYLFIGLSLRRVKNWRTFKLLAEFSWGYSLVLTLVILIVALAIQIYGIMLVPVVLLLLYRHELSKLSKLINKMVNGK